MSNIKVRLATTTALVTAMVGFFNLPAKANPEFIEGQAAVRTSAAVVNEDVQILPEVKKANVSEKEMDALINEISKKSRQQEPKFEIKVDAPRANPYLEPLVEFKDGKIVSRTVTKEVVDDLKDMNDLVYNMVKGYGLHQDRAQPVLERLQKAGWKWKNINGLEGLNSEFGINAGMVFYHPKKNLAKVVIAGTSSNDEGWEVNGKATLTNLTPADLQKAYFNDLMGEVEGMVKDALNPKARAVDPTTAASQELMNILHNKIDVGINYLSPADIGKIAARINKVAIEKTDLSEEWLRASALSSIQMDMDKTKLTLEQQNVIAKVLAREAVGHRARVERSKDKDYQAALKSFLKDTIQHYRNTTHKGMKERLASYFKQHEDEFESIAKSEPEQKARGFGKVKNLFSKKAEKKPSFGPLTKEQHMANVVKTNEDQSLAKVILAFGDLKLMTQAGKLDADKDFAKRLANVFNLKMQVMETVSKLEDNANARGKTSIGQGAVHLGFFQKSVSMVDDVAGILKELGVNKDSKVIVSGHSQAGGTGAQTLALLAETHGEDLFGEGFDNKKSNNLSGYFFSMARAGDQDYADYVNDLVGKDNMIRHNVHGDPVPIANGNEAFANWFRQTAGPVAYSMMYKNMGFGDIGTLALQDGHETYEQAKKLYAADGYDVSKLETLDLAMQYIAGKTGKNVPVEIIGKMKEAEFFNDPFTWIDQNTFNLAQKKAVYSMVKQIVKAVMGNEQAGKDLGELMTKRYAHFHLGYDEGMKNGTLMGAHYNPKLILDTDKCLEAGRKHEESGEK